jgi:hypothetical protein
MLLEEIFVYYDSRRLATGWKALGSNPGEGVISLAMRTGPEHHPAHCTNGTGCSLS